MLRGEERAHTLIEMPLFTGMNSWKSRAAGRRGDSGGAGGPVDGCGDRKELSGHPCALQLAANI